MTDTIKIEGLREVTRAMTRFDVGSKVAIKATHLEAAQVVAGEAKRLVPVRSGRLRDSIRGAGQQSGAVVRAGKSAVPYAGPIHFGWPKHNIEPNPFLYDAVDARRGEVLAAYEKNMDALIRKTFV